MKRAMKHPMKQHLTLHSAALQEDRDIMVCLPDSYQDNDHAPMHYPVVYLLDGEQYGDLVWALINNLSATQTMPEVILVAITAGEHRFRDLTPTRSDIDWQGQRCSFLKESGGMTEFLSFLAETLLPHIEANYRTLPYRTLLGHSLAGLAVCQSFLSQANLFQGLVALDASLWWDKQCLFEQAKTQLSTNEAEMSGREISDQTRRRRFYCGYVDHEIGGPNDGQRITQSNQCFVEWLNSKAGPDLALSAQMFTEETHQSICLPGFIAGLRFVFEGHRLPNGWAPNLQAIKAHYRAFSERMGFVYEPPERLIDALAWGPYPTLEKPVVLELLNDNVKRFSDSVHARNSVERWEEMTK